MDDTKPNSIDKIPKTLYDATMIIKKQESDISALTSRNELLSVSLSKANKKIEHLLAAASAPGKMVRSVLSRL